MAGYSHIDPALSGGRGCSPQRKQPSQISTIALMTVQPTDLSTDESPASKPGHANWLRPSLLPLLLGLILGVTVLGVSVWDEPLHIDELRQAGYYSRDVGGIVRGAISQQQPPLDYLIGAATERVIGPSDFARRLPGFGFGVLSLLFMGALLQRLTRLAWVAVAVLALTPLYLEFSTYARPYALPLALMFAFLLSLDQWRVSGHARYLWIGAVLAVLLPFSRTTEPPMFLGMTLMSLLFYLSWLGARQAQWARNAVAVTLLGMAIAIPVALVLFGETSDFQTTELNSIGAVIERLWVQILPVHVEATPFGVVGFLVGVSGYGAALYSGFRNHEQGRWWLLPLGLTALAAPLAFAVISLPSQPYFPRYTYFSLPPIAIGLAFATGWIVRFRFWLVVPLAALLTVGAFAVRSLTETHLSDYHAASDAVEPLIRGGDAVVWEQNRSLAGYRPKVFPGVPLYIPWSHQVIGSREAAEGDVQFEKGRRMVLLTQRFNEGLKGWTSVEVSEGFYILILDDVPTEWNLEDQSEALWGACLELEPEVGSYLCAAAVRILSEAGDLDRATENYVSMLDRISDPRVVEVVEASVADLGIGS